MLLVLLLVLMVPVLVLVLVPAVLLVVVVVAAAVVVAAVAVAAVVLVAVVAVVVAILCVMVLSSVTKPESPATEITKATPITNAPNLFHHHLEEIMEPWTRAARIFRQHTPSTSSSCSSKRTL